MATLLNARRALVSPDRSSACNLTSKGCLCTQRLQPESRRRCTKLRAASGATAEAPPQNTTKAPKEADEFPDVAPDSLTPLAASDKYAIVEIGGTQLFVQEGRWYSCNRLEAEVGQNVNFGRVLAVKENGKFNIGAPYLENATVKAEVVDEMKGPKLRIFKMRRKKHYRKKTGHRQPLSQFLITAINT